MFVLYKDNIFYIYNNFIAAQIYCKYVFFNDKET